MKINTKKLQQFYKRESSCEIRSFVSECVHHFLEGGDLRGDGTRALNENRVSFLKDLGLLDE